MTELTLADEPLIRLGAFLAVLVLMAIWEAASPRRRREIPRALRWTNNLAIVLLDTLLVRLAFPVLGVGLAVVAHDRGWGLLNVLDVPALPAIVLSVVALDLVIYLQHVMFHAVPALWRLHRMHHADLEFDVTTGLRFHPVEILLSMGIKLAVVAALGPPAVAVLIFEVLLNATAMFNHSNVELPVAVDRLLRLVVVTPDMHRVHHSIHASETNTNFGFNLPWWDRLLGTYKAQPRDGHTAMTIGIEQFRSRRDLWLDRMLTQPLRGPASGYPINRTDTGARPADDVPIPADTGGLQMKTLLILNDPPYGTERCYNALRLALALLKKDPAAEVTVFLMADAVTAARKGQKTPDGYYNLERMLKRVASGPGAVLLCGTCMDARGMADTDVMDEARRSTMDALAEATVAADKVLVF